MKSDVFNVELNKIEDEDIKESTKYILNKLPDYFYEVPASSTGKYHPSFSLGKGGLIRHTKVAVRIAEELFSDSVFSTFTEHEKDIIRMAIILHDGLKSGINKEEYTSFSHPLIMSDFILENSSNLSISDEDTLCVCRLIKSHMGPWNKKGDIPLPIPKEKDEIFVHLCDYIASRRFLNVNFDNNEITDEINTKRAI